MTIQMQTEGRRTYLLGNTYPVRDRIRAIGAHWDAGRKAWWTAKRAEAEQLVAELNQSQTTAQPANDSDKTPRDGERSVVAGRVTYKGKTYYLAGRTDRGRTQYDDSVDAITTRDGSKYLLYFRDGSSQFWAARELVQIVKTYDRPQTIRGLREYAERAKQAGSRPGERLESGYYYGPNGEVLASGCSACRQLGHMCRTCQHDYE